MHLEARLEEAIWPRYCVNQLVRVIVFSVYFSHLLQTHLQLCRAVEMYSVFEIG